MSDRLLLYPLLSFLTVGFIRWFRRGEYCGTEVMSTDSGNVTVYKFKKESPLPAQTTLWGTIIWNQTVLGDASDEERRLALQHELSHCNRNGFYRGLFLGSLSMFVAGFWILLYAVPLHFLRGGSITDITAPVIVGLLMIGAFLILWRIEETWADYDAICALDEDKFMKGYEELGSGEDVPLIFKILGKLVYTEPKHTCWLYRRFNGG